MIGSYRHLDGWQESMLLVEEIYALSRRFPTDEYFGLTTQLRRAAVSIPSSIAEASAFDLTRESLRFIALAQGSTAEVETQVLVAERLRMAEPPAAQAVLQQCGRVAQSLNRLHQSVHRGLDDEHSSAFTESPASIASPEPC